MCARAESVKLLLPKTGVAALGKKPGRPLKPLDSTTGTTAVSLAKTEAINQYAIFFDVATLQIVE